jgi:hypothetical protein
MLIASFVDDRLPTVLHEQQRADATCIGLGLEALEQRTRHANGIVGDPLEHFFAAAAVPIDGGEAGDHEIKHG